MKSILGMSLNYIVRRNNTLCACLVFFFTLEGTSHLLAQSEEVNNIKVVVAAETDLAFIDGLEKYCRFVDVKPLRLQFDGKYENITITYGEIRKRSGYSVDWAKIDAMSSEEDRNHICRVYLEFLSSRGYEISKELTKADSVLN